MTFVYFALIVLPLVLLFVTKGWDWLATGQAHRTHRNWGITPGREVVHRRGRWHWRTAL